MLFKSDAQQLYELRQREAAITAEIAEIERQIEEAVPALVARKALLEAERTDLRKQADKAKTTLADNLLSVVYTQPDAYGDGKLFPFAVVERRTVVEPNMQYAGFVADWLVRRGRSECVNFKFTPIDAFKHLTEEELPHAPNGDLAMRVYEAPFVKIYDHKRWLAPEQWGEAESV